VARRKKRPQYWFRRFLALLLILSPFLLWWGWRAWKDLPLKAEGAAPRVVAGPVYVAVLGVDERQNDGGRSDTLMLLRLDAAAGRLDVINVPRDTLISYKDKQNNVKQAKINAAYAIGGTNMTTDVLGHLLSIPTPYYIELNFKAFEDIVNKLGGVTIDVEKHYVYQDPFQNLSIDIKPGTQTLMGEQALKYVRLRYDGVTNSDIARIDRQQKFLRALKEKLSSPSYWTRIPDLVAIVRRNVATNIPEADQLKLAQAMWKAKENVVMTKLPGAPNDATGDWLFDPAGWKGVTDGWSVKTPAKVPGN
jgi:LCP family protein required for cell wall assembly